MTEMMPPVEAPWQTFNYGGDGPTFGNVGLGGRNKDLTNLFVNEQGKWIGQSKFLNKYGEDAWADVWIRQENQNAIAGKDRFLKGDKNRKWRSKRKKYAALLNDPTLSSSLNVGVPTGPQGQPAPPGSQYIPDPGVPTFPQLEADPDQGGYYKPTPQIADTSGAAGVIPFYHQPTTFVNFTPAAITPSMQSPGSLAAQPWKPLNAPLQWTPITGGQFKKSFTNPVPETYEEIEDFKFLWTGPDQDFIASGQLGFIPAAAIGPILGGGASLFSAFGGGKPKPPPRPDRRDQLAILNEGWNPPLGITRESFAGITPATKHVGINKRKYLVQDGWTPPVDPNAPTPLGMAPQMAMQRQQAGGNNNNLLLLGGAGLAALLLLKKKRR